MPVFDDKQKVVEIEREKYNFIANQYYTNWHETYYCLNAHGETGQWFLWNSKTYKEVNLFETMNRIAEIYPENEKMNIKKHKEILENLKRIACIRASEMNTANGFTFRNGFLEFENFRLLPHDKKRICTILLDYNFDENASCPMWLEALSEICENDINKINCIQEFFGYCLSKKNTYKKALILVGESNTGKSVILHVLHKMLGDENVSCLPLECFNEGQQLTSLENKLANITTETDPHVEQYETNFKVIVDGEPLEVNPKYLSKYKIIPFCKLAMAANRLPRIDDKSNAVYNRMLLIQLNHVFAIDEQKMGLRDEIVAKELSGVLNWAIEGLKKLNHRGKFLIDPYMQSLLEDLKDENNPVLQWAKDAVIPASGKELGKSEVYERYKSWASANGYGQLGLAKFSFLFFEIFSQYTKKKAQHASGDRKRIWPGLAWRTETEAEEEQKVWEE